MEEKDQVKNSGSNEERKMNANLEEIAVNMVKVLLEENVPFEDIEHLTGKSIEDIKRIGGITD